MCILFHISGSLKDQSCLGPQGGDIPSRSEKYMYELKFKLTIYNDNRKNKATVSMQRNYFVQIILYSVNFVNYLYDK